MRLFIDECLSPRIAAALNAGGLHLAVHPRDFGGLGDPDHAVLARCLAEDLAIVTQNARDFRALVAREDILPGLILLPGVGRAEAEALLTAALAHLAALGDPQNVLVNHVLEVDETGACTLFPLP